MDDKVIIIDENSADSAEIISPEELEEALRQERLKKARKQKIPYFGILPYVIKAVLALAVLLMILAMAFRSGVMLVISIIVMFAGGIVNYFVYKD